MYGSFRETNYKVKCPERTAAFARPLAGITAVAPDQLKSFFNTPRKSVTAERSRRRSLYYLIMQTIGLAPVSAKSAEPASTNPPPINATA